MSRLSLRKLVKGAALLAALLVIVCVVITVAPRFLVDFDLAGSTVPDAERLRAVGIVRSQILTILGGVVIFFGAYATWRRIRISEAELRATREGQITDRYTRAVEQLGSPSLDVRVGGIFALERIARNSESDRGPIIEVLSAYARTRSPWPVVSGPTKPIDDLTTMATRAADIQASLTVLGRIPHVADVPVRLPATDLRKARLRTADLRGALLGSSNLQMSRLTDALLVECDLGGADLRGASLARADLSRSNLCGANLREIDLSQSLMRGAAADASTRWPRGFDPMAAGVNLEADSALGS